MLCTRLLKQFKLLRVRRLHTTCLKHESKPTSETPKTAQPNTQDTQTNLRDYVIGPPLHTVSDFDKKVLVWVKRFPSIEEVPRQVTISCMRNAHTKIRIQVCYLMMVFAIVGFFVSSMLGKRDAAAGKSIATERQKWYDNVREMARKERAEKEAAERAEKEAAERAEKEAAERAGKE